AQRTQTHFRVPRKEPGGGGVIVPRAHPEETRGFLEYAKLPLPGEGVVGGSRTIGNLAIGSDPIRIGNAPVVSRQELSVARFVEMIKPADARRINAREQQAAGQINVVAQICTTLPDDRNR